MPRPRNCRRIASLPEANYFKPRGIPLALLEYVTLTLDELEAIKLTDLNGLYHTQAAQEMNISRQTLGRILESAHKKIADALTNGKALSIKGGTVKISPPQPYQGPPYQKPGAGKGRGRGHRGKRNI